MIDEAAIRLRWDAVGSHLDERGRRLFAAAEVRTAGRSGLAIVSKITGLARSTLNRGKKDLDATALPKGRVRRAGGGRRAGRGAALEARTAKAGRPDRARDPRPPLSARHIEMEQDRAPVVLPHHAELARPAIDRKS